MFVWSIKTSKKELWMLLLSIILFICAVVYAFMPAKSAEDAALVTAADTSFSAETPEQRINFLGSFGWQVKSEPTEVRDIVIPIDFTDVYKKYNDMQKKQGFNLEDYKGKKVIMWTYQITNYPESKENVYANMLVYNNEVIGGDVCSYSLNGFMHGFKKSDNTKIELSVSDVFSVLKELE